MSDETLNSAPTHFEEAPPAQGRKRARFAPEAPTLTMTSLMDMMTIMLVFLLVSITSDPLAIKESSLMAMPRAAAQYPAIYSIVVQVNKKEILVDQKKALTVSCKLDGRPCTDEDLTKPGAVFYVDPVNKEHGKRESLLVVPLKTELQTEIKRMKDQNVGMPEELRKRYAEAQGAVTLVVDRDIPFRMVAEIVYTVASAELNDIRFAVVYTEHK